MVVKLTDKLSFSLGLEVLLFHGRYSKEANAFNLTNVFDISNIYGGGLKNELIVMYGYIIGGFTRNIRQYGEGNYLLSEKAGLRQKKLLISRGLTHGEVWIRHPWEIMDIEKSAGISGC